MLLMTTASVLAGFGGGRESSEVKERTLDHTGNGHLVPPLHVFRLHVHKSKQRVALLCPPVPSVTPCLLP